MVSTSTDLDDLDDDDQTDPLDIIHSTGGEAVIGCFTCSAI